MEETLKINEDKIINDFYPDIEKAISYLDAARQKMASLSVPNDFGHSMFFVSMDAKMQEYVIEAKKIKGDVTQYIEDIKNVENFILSMNFQGNYSDDFIRTKAIWRNCNKSTNNVYARGL